MENWTKRREVDVFAKQLVFIPIVQELHWSLCVLVNPGHVMNALNVGSISEDDLLSCILFFDSLLLHEKYRIRDNIIRWLNSEWDRLRKFEDPSWPMPFTSQTFPIFTPTGMLMLLLVTSYLERSLIQSCCLLLKFHIKQAEKTVVSLFANMRAPSSRLRGKMLSHMPRPRSNLKEAASWAFQEQMEESME